MNNYEKIKNMTLEEMVRCLTICNGICDFCIYRYLGDSNKCEINKCVRGITQWLEQEV